MFLLALLSKEYAVILLILVPLAIYTFTDNEIDLKQYFTSKLALQILTVLVSSIIVLLLYKKIIDQLDNSKVIKTSLWFKISLVFLVPLNLFALKKVNGSRFMGKLQAFVFTKEFKNSQA